MTEAPLGRVAIFGGGVAAWMTAAGLARALGGRAEIRVVETLQDPTGALTALPSLRAFHALLGLDEATVMKAARGTYRLGTRFSGWTPDEAWCDAFGEIGATLDGVAFHHHWSRAHAAGAAGPLDDYNLAAVAASLGRFAHPDPDPRSPLSTLSYGLHLDAALYVDLLRETALRHGVTAKRGVIVGGEGAEGSISAVVLADGEKVEADLFIDCTGPEASLIRQGLAEPVEDWSALLPANRAVRVTTALDGDPSLLTQVEAVAEGWRRIVPLRDRLDVTLTYDRNRTSDDEALAAVLAGLPTQERSEPEFSTLSNGRRARAMVGRCVAIGASAGAVEDIDGAALHLIQSGVTRLIALFPRSGQHGVAAEEYNRLIGETYDRVRDLAVLHYRLCRRGDGAIWSAGRDGPVPDKLDYKVVQFLSRGRVVMYDEETFLEPSWIAALIGHGATPKRIDPLAERMPPDRAVATLERMREIFRRTAEGLPTHAQALATVHG